MDLQATLQTEHENLQIRLELIDQIQTEYEDDVKVLQDGIEKLMDKLVDDGATYMDPVEPLIARLFSELIEAADSSVDIDTDDSDDDNDFHAHTEYNDNDDLDADFDINDEMQSFSAVATTTYPKRIASELAAFVVLGQNGTTVLGSAFDRINWITTASATRSLLSLVFSEDILATHTLTGKPSPAFHGRERPSKMQLDPLKTSDIIQCVLAMCLGSNERSVRSSITTKCADTAKKYKRRNARR